MHEVLSIYLPQVDKDPRVTHVHPFYWLRQRCTGVFNRVLGHVGYHEDGNGARQRLLEKIQNLSCICANEARPGTAGLQLPNTAQLAYSVREEYCARMPNTPLHLSGASALRFRRAPPDNLRHSVCQIIQTWRLNFGPIASLAALFSHSWHRDLPCSLARLGRLCGFRLDEFGLCAGVRRAMPGHGSSSAGTSTVQRHSSPRRCARRCSRACGLRRHGTQCQRAAVQSREEAYGGAVLLGGASNLRKRGNNGLLLRSKGRSSPCFSRC